MRTPKYLSPTSVMKFYKDREEYYLNYLADTRPPRFPQTQPMSVGSAFDAYIKCYLSDHLGLNLFKIDELFEQQVEEQNRDWARIAGKTCFDVYVECGAAAMLVTELEASSIEPRFEFTVEGVRGGSVVPLLGKPDLSYQTKSGKTVIIDWKVNGYCSKASPRKGYVRIFPEGNHHKDALIEIKDNMAINVYHNLEDVNVDWATQLAIYGWVLGIDDDMPLVGIDQITCGAKKGLGEKGIRVAMHRCYIGDEFLKDLADKIEHVWEAIKSVDTVFDGPDSAEICARLDTYHLAFKGDDGFAAIMGR